MFKRLTQGALCCLALFFTLPLSAQVSGYLGKRKAFGIYADLTPALNPATGSERSLDFVDDLNNSGIGSFIGIHTRLGIEYITVTHRRKLWAFGADASRLNYKENVILYLGDIPIPSKLTATAIKFQAEWRKFGYRRHGRQMSTGGLAPLGSFTGYGMRLGFLFPDVYKNNAERFGLAKRPIIVPDIYMTTGKTRIVSDKILLTQNLRIGFGFLYYWLRSESGNFTTDNREIARDALSYQTSLTDFVRLSFAIQLLR